MTHLTFCTKDLHYNIKYLGDYLGFEESKEIITEVHDMKCFWGATIYDDTDKMNIDLKHSRTYFYINYFIPLEELTDSEIAMLMRKHSCNINDEEVYGSLLIDSDNYEVDFEPTFEDGVLKPFNVEILVDQHYMHII